MSIEAYLDYHRNSWSETTLKSAASRLRAITEYPNPETAYEALKGRYKPYTLKTLFIRAGHYFDWLGCSDWTQWMKRNRNLFKQAYQFKPVGVTYEEAREKIATLKPATLRNDCEAIISTGLRISETGQIAKGVVVGKGSKPRPYMGSHRFKHSQREIRQALKSVGLKPHDLRKLFATRCAERLSPQDLCKVMGWSSIETAYRYLQPKSDSELKEMVNASL